MKQTKMPVALRKTDSVIGITDQERLDLFEMTRSGYLSDRGGTPEDLGADLAERRAEFLANAAWITQGADETYRKFTNEMREAEPQIIKIMRGCQRSLKGPRHNLDNLPGVMDTCEKVLRIYAESEMEIEPSVESVRISGPCGACGTPMTGTKRAFVTIASAGAPEWSIQSITPACPECVGSGRKPENATLTPEPSTTAERREQQEEPVADDGRENTDPKQPDNVDIAPDLAEPEA